MGPQGCSAGLRGLSGHSGAGSRSAQGSTQRGFKGVWRRSLDLGGSEVAQAASVVGGAGESSELSLRGAVKGARLAVGGGSRLVSTRGTHLLTVRHWHPLEYPQGRVAHRHPLLLPAGHNADGPDWAWATMATNLTTPPRSGWPRGASIQHPAAFPPPLAM